MGESLQDAMNAVDAECVSQCSCSRGDFGEQTTSPAPGSSLKVMSYNTVYTGYPSRVDQFGQKIRDVNAAVVGTQECQDANALARASGYVVVPGTGPQNPIFYNPQHVSLVDGSGGYMNIPRDNYAQRTITWGEFMFGNTNFWFFNTHLPHPHGAASSRNTHAQIAQQLIQKREDLGAVNTPTVIVGDCNPFASHGATEGSFESNLEANGFFKAYQAQGNTGGYAGLDKIFASDQWTSSNGRDDGTGSSDHPAISADLAPN
jgi:endonuclease/exonuclease/phosphatase family metal-dependent hydrolase